MTRPNGSRGDMALPNESGGDRDAASPRQSAQAHSRLAARRTPLLVTHPWEPVCDARSKVLILGTMPSPKSRETGCYYGNPQNCFWPTLARVLGLSEPAPERAAREVFLLQNRIALWDVLHACEIDGAADGSIKNPVVNRFRPLLARTSVTAIFATGKTACELFNRLCADEAGMRAGYLPSTSPANRAAQAKPSFLEQWAKIRSAL